MKKLTRRTALRGALGGVAVTVGLPFLDSYLNENGTALAATGQALPTRFGHYYQGLGLNPGMWIPKKVGANYENNVQLKLFDPFKDRMNIFSGMRYFLDGRPHETHTSTVQIATTGALFDGGKIGPSLDSNIADVIGTRTRFRSLEVSFDGSTASRSRRSGSSTNPSEGSPAALYARIFGPEFKDPNAADFTPDPLVMARKSVLSYVGDQRKNVVEHLSATDRVRLDEYFTAVREIEQQLALELEKPAPMEACSVPDRVDEAKPDNVLDSVLTNSKLMARLLAYAMACGQTRVFNVNTGTNGWRRAGSSYSWHGATHEESFDPVLGYQKEVFRFTTFANEVFLEFIRTLDSVREGDRTLLDRTLVLWQTDHGDARTHSIEDIPIMTVGSAGGLVKTGMHIVAAGDPCCRAGLTVQQVFGVPLNTWGNRSNETTRTITEIVANPAPKQL
ncbi:MAG: DUF1552 domain-containing protein [Rhodospirillaceae bacterium]